MKKFLTNVNIMLGELSSQGMYEIETLHRVKEAYEGLGREEQIRSIGLLSEILQEDYNTYYYIMSLLLLELKDANVVFCIGDALRKDNNLWRRHCMAFQMKAVLFMNKFLHQDEYREHQMLQNIYESITEEIKGKVGVPYAYVPYSERKNTIVLIAWQLLGMNHAPTKKIVDIHTYLKCLGYEVRLFICFWNGIYKEEEQTWYQAREGKNIYYESKEFIYSREDNLIRGYNLVLKENNYIYGLREAVDKIWNEKPEWVFELGGRSILADLCQQFTTVVSMNFIKSAPITCASIVARYFTYSEKEDVFFRECLKAQQKVIDVPHEIKGIEKKGIVYKKSDFGISEEAFVIIVAGNRLDSEVDGKFLQTLYEILECNEKFVIVMIGVCKKLQKMITSEKYAKRIYFLGFQKHFREVISMGDVFLNPPRQGGGTGGLFAILEQVPVITLDDCDVESICGKEFVCTSIEKMPALVQKYYNESAFMEKQKEYCRINSEKFMKVDSISSFSKLCDLVRVTAIEEEQLYEL